MRKFISYIGLLVAAVTLCIGHCGAAPAKPKIAVLVSYNGTPYEQALSGIKEYLGKQDISFEYQVYELNGDAK